MSIPSDVLIERQVDQAIKTGFPLPRWGWSVPRPYNGFTGLERIVGWQKLRVAQRLGLILRDPHCSVCLTAKATQDHTEIYCRPIISMSVCKSCHFRLHRRFDDHGQWRALLRRRGNLNDWPSSLHMVELDPGQAMAIAAAPDIFTALRLPSLF